MKKELKVIIGIICFVTFILLAILGYKYLTSKYNNILEDFNINNHKKSVAKDFTVTDTNGNKVKLSDFAGKPVVINFWATWCYYCTQEMPYFDRIYQENKEDVVFLMINATDGMQETKEMADEYIKEEGFSFPIYYDEGLKVITDYGITGYPATIFIDKDGNINKNHKGLIKENILEGYIKELKGEGRPPIW